MGIPMAILGGISRSILEESAEGQVDGVEDVEEPPPIEGRIVKKRPAIAHADQPSRLFARQRKYKKPLIDDHAILHYPNDAWHGWLLGQHSSPPRGKVKSEGGRPAFRLGGVRFFPVATHQTNPRRPQGQRRSLLVTLNGNPQSV